MIGGLPDISMQIYHDGNLVFVAQPKLANDGTQFGAGQAVVTPSVIRGELIALFGEWEDRALVENKKQFIADMVVQRNAENVDRLDFLISPDLINQMRVFAGQIQFLL